MKKGLQTQALPTYLAFPFNVPSFRPPGLGLGWIATAGSLQV
ncbi:hypothetical protein [Cupriavidus sp. SK-3]|nr:hypothetical protein [Cupriavidus sp. SK-3]